MTNYSLNEGLYLCKIKLIVFSSINLGMKEYMSPNAGVGAGSQPMSTAVHMEPK
jgi:hypothetical protein